MSGNTQNQLGKVRKPRVHITLDVQSEGKPTKELPFVIGVMGDFSGDPYGNPDGELPHFSERSFVNINRDNFDKVLKGMGPGLSLLVENRTDDPETDRKDMLPVKLTFESLADFEPARIAKQVPKLRELMEIRAKLRDLLAKADRSATLEQALEEMLRNREKLEAVTHALAAERAKPAGEQ
jgi:type VI secretion system protein ImpB